MRGTQTRGKEDIAVEILSSFCFCSSSKNSKVVRAPLGSEPERERPFSCFVSGHFTLVVLEIFDHIRFQVIMITIHQTLLTYFDHSRISTF